MAKTRSVIVTAGFLVLFLIVASVAIAEKLTIRIHCRDGYAKPYAPAFKEMIKNKYGEDIDMQITNASDPSEFWELARGKKVDIISPAHNIPKSLRWNFIEGGVALPINIKNIPNYKHLIDLLRYNDFVTKDGEVYGMPYTMGSYGLAYNADKVKEPDSWNILLSDAAKHKFTISKDYPDCNIYTAALLNGVPYNDLYDIEKLLSRVSRNKLQKTLNILASNAKSQWEGTANPDEFNTLSYAATWGYAVAQANLKGGNWKMAKPKEGTNAWVDHWLITYAVRNDPFKKHICEEWINFCLSPRLQVNVIRNWGVSPVVSNILGLITKEEADTYMVGENEYWKTLSFWGKQNARTTNFYKLFWDKAMLFED